MERGGAARGEGRCPPYPGSQVLTDLGLEVKACLIWHRCAWACMAALYQLRAGIGAVGLRALEGVGGSQCHCRMCRGREGHHRAARVPKRHQPGQERPRGSRLAALHVLVPSACRLALAGSLDSVRSHIPGGRQKAADNAMASSPLCPVKRKLCPLWLLDAWLAPCPSMPDPSCGSNRNDLEGTTHSSSLF